MNWQAPTTLQLPYLSMRQMHMLKGGFCVFLSTSANALAAPPQLPEPHRVCLNRTYCVDGPATLKQLSQLTKLAPKTLQKARPFDAYIDICFRFKNAYVAITFTEHIRPRWTPIAIEVGTERLPGCGELLESAETVEVAPFNLGSPEAAIALEFGKPSSLIEDRLGADDSLPLRRTYRFLGEEEVHDGKSYQSNKFVEVGVVRGQVVRVQGSNAP